MTQLPNPCQAHLAPEIAANHSETSCTAIHFIDLHDVVDFTDALAAFAEQSLFVRKGSFCVLGFGRRTLAIQLNLVLHLRFRRQQFGREIKRNACFFFGLVKCETLTQ